MTAYLVLPFQCPFATFHGPLCSRAVESVSADVVWRISTLTLMCALGLFFTGDMSSPSSSSSKGLTIVWSTSYSSCSSFPRTTRDFVVAALGVVERSVSVPSSSDSTIRFGLRADGMGSSSIDLSVDDKFKEEETADDSEGDGPRVVWPLGVVADTFGGEEGGISDSDDELPVAARALGPWLAN